MTECGDAVLLALLNSTPLVDGVPIDPLGDDAEARTWLAAQDLDVPVADRETLRRGRDRLQAAARGTSPADELASLLDGIVARRIFVDGSLAWPLGLDGGGEPAGSKSTTGRWCSRVARGNRREARRHHERIWQG